MWEYKQFKRSWSDNTVLCSHRERPIHTSISLPLKWQSDWQRTISTAFKGQYLASVRRFWCGRVDQPSPPTDRYDRLRCWRLYWVLLVWIQCSTPLELWQTRRGSKHFQLLLRDRERSHVGVWALLSSLDVTRCQNYHLLVDPTCYADTVTVKPLHIVPFEPPNRHLLRALYRRVSTPRSACNAVVWALICFLSATWW